MRCIRLQFDDATGKAVGYTSSASHTLGSFPSRGSLLFVAAEVASYLTSASNSSHRARKGVIRKTPSLARTG